MHTGGSRVTSPADVGGLLAVVGHVEGEPALPLRVVHAESVTVLQRGKAGDGAQVWRATGRADRMLSMVLSLIMQLYLMNMLEKIVSRIRG